MSIEKWNTVAELIELAEKKQVPISAVVLAREAAESEKSEKEVLASMQKNWQVMQASVARGIGNTEKSMLGITGGDAKKLRAFAGKGYLDADTLYAAACAVGVSEVNAVMGRIVACPTAGSCGIVPAAACLAKRKRAASDDAIVRGLFTAAGIGMVIDQNASIAGASGGCQAECGTAAAMAAAMLVEIAGGSPRQAGHAAALAIKNLLGLVCDPVAGLVEVPCVKRNGFCTMTAALAADMALAGVESVIPVDEVVEAMDRIGRAIPKGLRETSEGGLAVTETAKHLAKRLQGLGQGRKQRTMNERWR